MRRRDVHVVKGVAALDDLRHEWTALTQTWPDAPFFVRYEWYRGYLEHLAGDEDALMFLVLVDETCRGILPLRRERHARDGFAVDVWVVPAMVELGAADVLVPPTEPLDDWWPQIARTLGKMGNRWMALKIPKVPERRASGWLSSALEPRSMFRPQGYSCYFEIDCPYDSLSDRYTTRLRKILRKGWNGLRAQGAVDVETARTGPALDAAFGEFVRLEGSGWKGSLGTGSALAHDASRRALFEQVYGDTSGASGAEVNLLVVGGRAVAAQLSTVAGDVRSVVKIAYDQSLQKLSPGSVLMDALVRRTCEERDVRRVSLVTGLGWMREWGAASETIGDLWLFRSRLAATAARWYVRRRDRRRPPEPVAELVAQA